MRVKETAKIDQVSVKSNGQVFVKILNQNGQPFYSLRNTEFWNDKIDKKPTVPNEILNFKILRYSDNSKAAIKVDATSAILYGSENHRIMSTENYGNFIVGPTTFTAHPEQIRIYGVYRLNGLMTSTMPSTIVTPIPVLVFDLPIKKTIKNITETIKDFQNFLRELLK